MALNLVVKVKLFYQNNMICKKGITYALFGAINLDRFCPGIRNEIYNDYGV